MIESPSQWVVNTTGIKREDMFEGAMHLYNRLRLRKNLPVLEAELLYSIKRLVSDGKFEPDGGIHYKRIFIERKFRKIVDRKTNLNIGSKTLFRFGYLGDDIIFFRKVALFILQNKHQANVDDGKKDDELLKSRCLY